MNYIELINNFWELDETWQFSCCETRLYFYIVKTANRLGWVDNWTHSDGKTSANVGVSVNSLKTARNRLIQAKLIKVENGGKWHGDKTRYQILIPKPQPNHEPKPQPNHEPKPQPKYAEHIVKLGYTNMAKLNKTKLNNNTPISPKGEIKKNEYDFIEPEFLNAFNIWMDYKKCRKEKYKSLESEIAFYNKLKKLSGENYNIAQDIVMQSLANNYAGIFELKQNNNQSNGTKINQSSERDSERERKQFIIDHKNGLHPEIITDLPF
jgi:hypothetical protein